MQSEKLVLSLNSDGSDPLTTDTSCKVSDLTSRTLYGFTGSRSVPGGGGPVKGAVCGFVNVEMCDGCEQGTVLLENPRGVFMTYQQMVKQVGFFRFKMEGIYGVIKTAKFHLAQLLSTRDKIPQCLVSN